MQSSIRFDNRLAMRCILSFRLSKSCTALGISVMISQNANFAFGPMRLASAEVGRRADGGLDSSRGMVRISVKKGCDAISLR